MSQRLLISNKINICLPKDNMYDCIYSENSNWKNLKYEWCAYDDEFGTFLAPFKICIRDIELMDQFVEDFKELGKHIYALKSFDDVWMIHDKQGNQVHVSKKENEKYEFIIQKLIDHIDSEESPR